MFISRIWYKYSINGSWAMSLHRWDELPSPCGRVLYGISSLAGMVIKLFLTVPQREFYSQRGWKRNHPLEGLETRLKARVFQYDFP